MNKSMSIFKLNNVDISNLIVESSITESIDNIYAYGNVVINLDNRSIPILKKFEPMLLTIIVNQNGKSKQLTFITTGMSYINKSNSLDKTITTVNIRFIDSESFKLYSNCNPIYLGDDFIGRLVKKIMEHNNILHNIDYDGVNKIEYLHPSSLTHGESVEKLLDMDDSIVGYMDIDGTFNVIDIKDKLLNYDKSSLVNDINLNINDYIYERGSFFDYFKSFNNGMFGYKIFKWDHNNKQYQYEAYSSLNNLIIKNPPIFKKSVTRTSMFNEDIIKVAVNGSFDNKLMKWYNVLIGNEHKRMYALKITHFFDNNLIWSNELSLFEYVGV